MGSLPVSLYLFLAVCVSQLKCCIWRFLLPEIQNKKNVLKETFYTYDANCSTREFCTKGLFY